MTVSSILYNYKVPFTFLLLSSIAFIYAADIGGILRWTAAGTTVLSALWMFMISYKNQKSVLAMTEACKKIAGGDFEQRVNLTHEKNADLISLGNALNNVVDNADAYLRESIAMFDHAAQEKFYRKVLTTGMVGSFRHGATTLNDSIDKVRANVARHMETAARNLEASVGVVIESLSQSAQSMSSTAAQMKSSSDDTSSISNIVAAAATQASANVQTVAAAAEELSASSDEISKQIDSVARQAQSTASDAEETRVIVSELTSLAESVGDVVGTIKEIADQTNLLALNATIEAARAGEAGKGFAVVADEVKKLATETATKTQEIDDRVMRIRHAIKKSVDAMEKIIASVNTINSATTSVASAVEEQNAATGEIGRNVSEASTGTQQVTQSILDVQHKAAETGQAADLVFEAANGLKSQSDTLKNELNKFITTIKAA